MRFVMAAFAAFFMCAGAASANPVLATSNTNPCLSSSGRALSERLIVCSETIASQTTLNVHIDARMERAKLYMDAAEWRRAIADYSEVVRRAPKFAPAYAALAEARAADENIPGAVTEYGRAIKLDPGNANYWAGRCWMSARLRDLAAALDDCEHALALQPDAHYARGARAFTHLLRRDYAAAIADFDAELVQVVSDRARAYALYGRGVARLLAGNAAGAQDMRGAERIDPTIAHQFETWGFMP
jgi:Tfp pilus assembly protein PilF